MDDADRERNPELAEIERRRREELGPDEEIEPVEAARQQDFGARNVIMSNALQGGASPAAGAVAVGGELGMQPTGDEELVEDEDDLPAHERREEQRGSAWEATARVAVPGGDRGRSAPRPSRDPHRRS